MLHAIVNLSRYKIYAYVQRVWGEFLRLTRAAVHSLYYSPHILNVVQWRKTRWLVHVARARRWEMH